MHMMKGLSGTVRQNVGAIAVAVLIVLLVITSGFVASFMSSEQNQPTLIASTIRTLNISVNNTNMTHNITKVVISFPRIDTNTPSFVYINNTNSTSASFTNFTIQNRSVLPFDVQNITWSNTTDNDVVNASQTEYFIFKAYVPRTAGTYNITVYTYDTTSVINSTNVTITVSGLSSSQGNFSSYENSVFFNWTNSTLTLEINQNKTQVFVDDLQTNISSVYFTESDYPVGSYIGTTNREKCFDVTDGFGLEVSAKNTSMGQLGFLNRTIPLNETNVTSFTLTLDNVFCPPGLYKGTFAIRNISDPSTDRIHVPATINIPISKNNTFNESGNTAYFKGSNTSQTIQSFYFFTNITDNITALTINLSLLQNADLFLFNSSGNLLEKSIGTGTSSEEVFRYLPSFTDRWEIRLINTITSFTGFLYFTTLNITNQTMSNTSIRNITFGSGPLTPNDTNTTKFRLVNEDIDSVENVREVGEVYNIQRFQNYNTSEKFEVYVPSYATKIKVRLEWMNESDIVTDWNLFLMDSIGRVIANSTNKTWIANSSNLEREEYITYTGPINTSYHGLWNITVINQTNDTALNYYNLTTLIYFNDALWINTSFNTSVDFNATGYSNSSYNVTAQATIPTINVLNGTYEGYIIYHNNSGWKLKLPFSFQLNAGHLFINNNLSGTTVQEISNVGNNRTVNMNITFNNTGGHPIYFINSTSNYHLYHSTNRSKNINFSIADIPDNPIQPGTDGTINVSVTLDTSRTENTPGIYVGWIYFNTSNTTVSSRSYPYDLFNLSIELNVTDRLNMTMSSVVSGYSNELRILNTSKKSNITMVVRARLCNGTVVSKNPEMAPGNFYSANIIEQNTSTTYSLTDLGVLKIGENLCDYPTAGICSINGTVPSYVVGGQYRVVISAMWNTSERNLTGTAVNTTLTVNDTGIYMSAPQSVALGNVNEATGVTYVNVTVGNLGPLEAISTYITLNKGPCPVTITRETSLPFSTGCLISSGSTGATHTATINSYTAVSSGCALRWKIAATNVTGDVSCNLNVTANRASFNNITDITFTVKETGGGSDDDDDSGSGGGPTTCTTDAGCGYAETCVSGTCTSLGCESDEYAYDHACVDYDVDISSYDSEIFVLAGNSNTTTVSVSEAGGKIINVKLNVTAEKANVTVSPESCATPCDFTVNFTTVAGAEIGTHTSTLKAFFSVVPTVYETKTFSLKILPTEDKKTEILQEYADYLPIIQEMQNQYNILKTQLSGDNLTVATDLINKMNNLSVEIQAAIDAGDYLEANSLLQELNDTITSIQDHFSSLTTTATITDIIIYVVIGVIVVGVVAIVAYMMLPQKGFGVSRGFKPDYGSRKFPSLGKSSEFFSGKKKKPTPMSGKASKYAVGYERQKSFAYKKKTGNPFSRLFKKRQQKKLGEFR